MESAPNLIIHPEGESLLASDGGRGWITKPTVDDGLERLALGNLHGCLIHRALLGDDGLTPIRAIRQTDPLVPVLLAGVDGPARMSAWHLGADGGLSDADFVLGDVESMLARFRRQRQARIWNRTTTTERRVLVVDDDEFLLMALRVVLEHAGFFVLEAGDALEALERLHSEDIHVMLTDIMMPKVSGTELVASTLAYAPQVVPRVITGLPGIDAAVESMRAGAQDFLVKPVDPDQLVERVERGWRRWLLGWQRSPSTPGGSGTRALLVEANSADAILIETLLKSSAGDQFRLSHADRLDTAILPRCSPWRPKSWSDESIHRTSRAHSASS